MNKFNRYNVSVLTLVCSMAAALPAFAEVGLRLKCSGSNQGAFISINGKIKGECPITLFVPAGDVTITAVKSVDDDHERRFETQLNLPNNSVKAVEIKLSASQLTPAAKKRLAKEKAQKEQDEAEKTLLAAREGDVAAMKSISNFYDTGVGVSQDYAKAKYWHDKAEKTKNINAANALITSAEKGDVKAMKEVANLYAQGLGVKKSGAKSQQWLEKYFAATLALAESGDTQAMTTVATLYREGEGVEKSEAHAKEWDKNLALALTHAEERKKAEARQAKVQKQLDDFRYGENAKWLIMDGPVASAMDNQNIFSITTVAPTMTTALLLLASSYPTDLTKRKKLEKELAEIAATWDNPDSMMAKSQAVSVAIESDNSTGPNAKK